MLAGRNPEMTRLAMVDAIMERSLSVRERALATTIPTLLGAHFERLRKAEQSAQEAEAAEMPPPAKPGAWLDTFRRTCAACCWPNWIFVFNRWKGCSRRFAPAN